MTDTFSFLAASTLRVAFLMAVVWLIISALRNSAAATRYSIWLIAFGAALFMPLAGNIVPNWEAPNSWPIARLANTRFAPEPSSIQAATNPSPAPAVPPGISAPATIFGAPAREHDMRQPFPWTIAALIVWAVGFLACIAFFAAGWVSARRIVARSVAATERRILESFARARQAANINARVSLRMSKQATIPFVFGALDPVVVLPAHSMSWDDEKLSIVLSHELSHVRRRDALAQWLVDLTCALHWLNPLVWLAAARLRRERELACDDEVMLKGTEPDTYARLLVSLAHSLGRELPHAALPVARRGTLETRVVAVLDGKRRRRDAKWVLAVLVVCVVGLQLSLASFHPASAAQLPTPVGAIQTPTNAGSATTDSPAIDTPATSSSTESQELPVATVAAVSEASSGLPTQLPPSGELAGNPPVFRVASRAGVCGRGIPDEITFTSRPLPSSEECRAGMTVVSVTQRAGRVVDVHATVGGPVPADAPMTEARQAARYLLSLIPGLEPGPAARAVQAAAMIDDGAQPDEILAVARGKGFAPETQRMAVTWFGIVAGNGAVQPLISIARDESLDPGVREQALIALGSDGTATALELARTSGSEEMRKRALNRVGR